MQGMSGSRSDPFGGSPTFDDHCSLGVSGEELQALRETILGLLAKAPSKREDFLRAEVSVPADCTRQRAIFYMRSLALARSKG